MRWDETLERVNNNKSPKHDGFSLLSSIRQCNEISKQGFTFTNLGIVYLLLEECRPSERKSRVRKACPTKSISQTGGVGGGQNIFGQCPCEQTTLKKGASLSRDDLIVWLVVRSPWSWRPTQLTKLCFQQKSPVSELRLPLVSFEPETDSKIQIGSIGRYILRILGKNFPKKKIVGSPLPWLLSNAQVQA